MPASQICCAESFTVCASWLSSRLAAGDFFSDRLLSFLTMAGFLVRVWGVITHYRVARCLQRLRSLVRWLYGRAAQRLQRASLSFQS